MFLNVFVFKWCYVVFGYYVLNIVLWSNNICFFIYMGCDMGNGFIFGSRR